jgi:hypothetical protein
MNGVDTLIEFGDRWNWISVFDSYLGTASSRAARIPETENGL